MSLTSDITNLIKYEVQQSTEDLREQVAELRRQLSLLRSNSSSDSKGTNALVMSPELQSVVDLDTQFDNDGSKQTGAYMALTQGDDKQVAREERPESLFCYCVFELVSITDLQGSSADLRRCRLMLMIALLVWVEFLLATALFESSWFVVEKELWAPAGANGPSSTCYYQLPPELFGIPLGFFKKVLYGKPRVEWAVAAFSYLVVLLTVKGDDRQVLAMPSPEPLSFWVGKGLFLLWMLRSFFRSAWISSATIVLIAGSTDIAAIILNSVAATFLLEIDDLAYSTVLSPEAQRRYQQASGRHVAPFCDPNQIEFFSWCFYALNWVAGSAMYLALTFVQTSVDPLKFRSAAFVAFPASVMLGRTFLFCYIHDSVKQEVSHNFSWLVNMVVKSILVFVISTLTGLVPWLTLGLGTDDPINIDSLKSCLNHSDTAACAC